MAFTLVQRHQLVDELVAKSGDTMTGFLTLHADPVNPMHAVTKQYVDGRIAQGVPLLPLGTSAPEWLSPSSFLVRKIKVSKNNFEILKEDPTVVSVSVNQSATLGIPHRYTFDEGSGTTVFDSLGQYNLSTIGATTWGSGYLNVTGAVGQQWQAPQSAYSQLGTFSFVAWVEFAAVPPTTKYVAEIGDGGVQNATNFAWGIYQIGTTLGTIISDGVNWQEIEIPSVLTTGVKYLIVGKYQRSGGANDNILTLRVTSDGTNWSEVSLNTAVLVQQNPSYNLRSLAGSTAGMDGKYYAMEIYENKILSENEMQAIWTAGSEGTVNAPDTIIPDLDWGFNDGSGLTVTESHGGPVLTIEPADGQWNWIPGGLRIDGKSPVPFPTWTAPAGIGVSDKFTAVTWVKFNNISASYPYSHPNFLSIGTGGPTDTYGFRCQLDNASSHVLQWSSNSGTTNSGGSLKLNGTGAFAVAQTGDTWMVAFAYEWSGSQAHVKMYASKDGVNWYWDDQPSTVQIAWNNSWHYSGFSHNDNNTPQGIGPHDDFTWFRLQHFENKFLTLQDLQDLYSAGSEAPPSTNFGTNAAYVWDFNEGAGQIAGSNKGVDITVTTSNAVWGSGYLSIDGAAGRRWSTPVVNDFNTADTFSGAWWVEFNSLDRSSGYFTALATGDASAGQPGSHYAARMSWGIYHTGNKIASNISNGSGLNSMVLNGLNLTTNTKYLVVMAYQKVGGASNNVHKIRATSDGITWYETVLSTQLLMSLKPTFKLVNKITSPDNEAAGNTKLHRTIIFPNKFLTNEEMQAIWDLGSEGSSNEGIPNFYTAISGLNSIAQSDVLTGGITQLPAINVSSINLTTDQMTFASAPNLITGTPVAFKTSGTMPVPLLAGNMYFVRMISPTVASLHPTAQDAIDDTNKINITTVGSGTSLDSKFLYGTGGTTFLSTFIVNDVVFLPALNRGRKITQVLADDFIKVATNFTGTVVNESYKRGGLAPSCHYYLYAISTLATAGLILSTRSVYNGNELVDLPNGFTKSIQLPFVATTNEDEKLLKFKVVNWPLTPLILYDAATDHAYSATAGNMNILFNTGTSASFQEVKADTFVPPLATSINLYVSSYGTSGLVIHNLRSKGSEENGLEWVNGVNAVVESFTAELPLFGSPSLEFKSGGGIAELNLSVLGYKLPNLG